MVCFITWLVKQLLIKLGWMKASEEGDNCGLAITNRRKA